MEKAVFTAYAALAQNDPTGGDHVCVASSDGGSWPCWGRSLQNFIDDKADYREVARGLAFTKWANLIVGDDGNAGLTIHVTGKCHNQANRILALAGTDVRTAGADAMIMFFFGKYGFDVPAYIERVKSAATKLKREAPDTLLDADINEVIAYINRAQQDELEILEEYFKQAIAPQVLNLTADQKAGIADIYRNFFNQRAALEGDPGSYAGKLRPVARDSLGQLGQLLGPDNYLLFSKAFPQYARDSLGL
jgi:hypothetical protein